MMSSQLPSGWIKSGSKYFIDHVSAKWRISKAMVRGDWVYTLWKRITDKHGDPYWALYGNYNTVFAANEVVINPPVHRLNRSNQ
jgi:hypothetical protein